MAMLRVSSYRKLFEDDSWSRNGGLSMQCAGQYRATVRSAPVDKCDCDKLDFVAAKAINREGLNQFVKDRTIIAALNDRLVKLIELARCFEEENESLECQIVELEDKLNSRQAFSSITSTVPDYSLDEVVERLRRERDEILCDTEELRKELECLMKEYEKAAQQRILFQQERQDVAEEVDAVTAGCLALREQVAIYEEQLANMEAQHETAVEDLLEPADGTTGTVAAIKFGSPDITPALDVKEYYCQLAENLQYECDAPSFAVVRSSDGKQLEAGGACRVNSESLAKDNGHRRRCEGLGFSSDRIYCLPCPRLLSTVFQSACCVINVLKLCTHTHTLTGDFLCEWKRGNKPSLNVSDLSQRKNTGKTERMKYTAKCGINKKTNQEIMTQISELQKELAELEKLNEELEDEVEMKKAAYMDEIAELEV
ncbi:Vimentin [Larimichthys crocea]|uniref:Uncharacterized protein n=1 Tax=Larimichthys crocea TaxID=215358 RepID=A0ACD3REM6_LARCR|nr:Vimentin [Larimichthys crocea]